MEIDEINAELESAEVYEPSPEEITQINSESCTRCGYVHNDLMSPQEQVMICNMDRYVDEFEHPEWLGEDEE